MSPLVDTAVTSPQGRRPGIRPLLDGAGRWLREFGILAVLIALVIAFSVATPTFLTIGNVRVLAEQSGGPLLVACGMTVVIIAGGFDLSAGAIFGCCGVIAVIVTNAAGPALAGLSGLAAGAMLGLLNGWLVVYRRVQSFLGTLATQFVVVGGALYLTRGTDSIAVNSPGALSVLAGPDVAGLQIRTWLVPVVLAGVWFVLRHTQPGRQVYAVGGSLQAATVAGVRTRAVLIAVFLASGVLSALAGVLTAADAGIAQADGGVGMELTAITAVVIGGTSIAGGRGSVWRTVIGVVLLSVIGNGFTLLYVEPTYNLLVQAGIILVAIVLDSRLKRKGRP